MAEPLKNIFNQPLLSGFAQTLCRVWPAFNSSAFENLVFDAGWAQRELKERMRHITICLGKSLPAAYPEALPFVVGAVDRLLKDQGEKMAFEYCFLPDFVEVFGLEHPELSISALEAITCWCSAEFAVRPFLRDYPQRMYPQMLAWTEHESPMVRRLASEGFRPRLPWGMGIPALKRDPAPILPVLENLKADPAETVRRSVANNLNDISKDHPDLALQLARRWQGYNPDTDWVVRHALRGLLKKGHPDALALFGFEQDADGISIENLRASKSVRIGDTLEFSFLIKNTAKQARPVRLEYAIEYLTGSGKVSRKVFKIKELILEAGAEDAIERRQRFTDFTTRKHYPGEHRLHILANGRVLAAHTFTVVR